MSKHSDSDSSYFNSAQRLLVYCHHMCKLPRFFSVSLRLFEFICYRIAPLRVPHSTKTSLIHLLIPTPTEANGENSSLGAKELCMLKEAGIHIAVWEDHVPFDFISSAPELGQEPSAFSVRHEVSGNFRRAWRSVTTGSICLCRGWSPETRNAPKLHWADEVNCAY